VSGVWAVGIMVGIKILFTGWGMLFIGMAAGSESKGNVSQEPTLQKTPDSIKQSRYGIRGFPVAPTEASKRFCTNQRTFHHGP